MSRGPAQPREPEQMAPALIDGDAIGCARCNQVFAFHVAALTDDARLKCPRCGGWVSLPLRRS